MSQESIIDDNCGCADGYDCYKTHAITCKYCGEEAVKTHHEITQLGAFCSVSCAQKDYEDQWLDDELSSEDPQIDGLEEALLRRV